MSTGLTTPEFGEALQRLRDGAARADGARVWPGESWEALCAAGVPRWSVPRVHGGDELDARALLDGYEALAGACLTTCFLLSQREAAVRRIRDSANAELRARLLPALARGKCFATVGLSQLTTSRQHGAPALVARDRGDTIVLNGVMPWVTGAGGADYFVTGAVVEGEPEPVRQVLAVLPRNLVGVSVGEPLELAALEGSLTAEVRCVSVELARSWVLAGPMENVMASSRGGAGGLETSCLALGLAGAAHEYLAAEAARRPDLRSSAERFAATRVAIRQEMHRQARQGGTPQEAGTLRACANSLVLRATQAALTASKGAGFVRGHPAQRWARQAHFFLVWSCPRPAAEATLAYLSGDCEL